MKYVVLLAFGQLYASSDEALVAAVAIASNDFGALAGSGSDSEMVQASRRKAPVPTPRKKAGIASLSSPGSSPEVSRRVAPIPRPRPTVPAAYPAAQRRTVHFAEGVKKDSEGKIGENVGIIERSSDLMSDQWFDEDGNFSTGFPTEAEKQARIEAEKQARTEAQYLRGFVQADKIRKALDGYVWLLQHPQLVRDIQIEYLMRELGILEDDFDLALLDSLIIDHKLNEIKTLQTAAKYYLENHKDDEIA